MGSSATGLQQQAVKQLAHQHAKHSTGARRPRFGQHIADTHHMGWGLARLSNGQA